MFFYVPAILVLLIDQLSKIIIRATLAVGDTIYIGSIKLTHYENAGMAFSLFQGYARLFAVVAILFVLGILYFRMHEAPVAKLLNLALGFLAGGAAGNAIDRIVFGRVTDFLVSRSGNGILNFADHAINVGIVLLVLHGIVQVVARRRGSR
ncbi:signal peptidase II [Brevibacillus choshinensis]|uniref:Lipoprotein signal peptidase n=1 Tax=Brevibacillus choshinensis TaxID=54911 RepID=A0ABX7FH95_BRECH|nr:signal peptidase II [Brevibacillus choshinensis]QRG65522.1 signal peptidase II [Brevibacillus choshinensis]